MQCTCITLSLTLLLSTTVFPPAKAQLSTWYLPRIPAVLFVTPEGNGNTLAEIDNVLEVQFIDPGGDPIALHPPECILCVHIGVNGYLLDDLAADHATDESGMTTFSGGVAGGGSSQEGLYLYATGCVLPWAVEVGIVPVHFNSPDIDGNGVVDLRDLSIFARDFTTGYHFRSDLRYDGRLDLADVARFAMHLGERRP